MCLLPRSVAVYVNLMESSTAGTLGPRSGKDTYVRVTRLPAKKALVFRYLLAGCPEGIQF